MKFSGFYVLNLDPLVLSCVGHPRVIPAWAKPCILLEHPAWYQGYWLKMLKHRRIQNRLAEKEVERHLIVNTPRELSMAKLFRLRSTFASQNIFLDEALFQPQPQPKDYDAVYVAKLEPFKRHRLAAEIKKLAILSFAPGDLSDFCPAISHATTNAKPLNFSEVAGFINRSHCSLALSKEEGGMLASFESLLCGVPVVSTRSRGGRDLFYDEENSKIVAAKPGAVSAAVRGFISNPPEAETIRAKALRDLQQHRNQFAKYVCDLIANKKGRRFDPQDFIESRFRSGGCDRLFVANNASEIPRPILNDLK